MMALTSTLTSSTILSPRLVCKPSSAYNTDKDTAKNCDSTFNDQVINAEDQLLECSLHTLPKSLKREFEHVFRGEYKNHSNKASREISTADTIHVSGTVATENGELLEILAIPTNQRARKDLVSFGDDVEAEKDRLLHVFMSFASELCELIRSRGFWADYIDPCSGLPMITSNCNKVYSEVYGMEVLLGYRSQNAGCCKVLLHPLWGSSVYPATIFCYATRDAIREILERLPTSEMI